MQSVNVKLNNFEQIIVFIKIIDRVDAVVNVRTDTGVINAKSILGICTLDITNPLQLNIYSDDQNYKKILMPFLY